MKTYCDRDVEILEQLYLELRPFIPNHPNVALLSGEMEACPKCGSLDIQYRGYQCSNVATYRRIQCQHCKGWSRVRQVEKYTDKPKFVNISPSM
jgi:hypothetical protein